MSNQIPTGSKPIPMPDPKDGIAWNNWRHQHENGAEQMFQYGIRVACPKHPAPDHTPRPVMACDHCEQQDEVHPKGILFMPKKYFLCRECFNLLERHRFHLGTDLKIRCRLCIKAEIIRISQINPTLCDDLSIPK